MHLRKIILNNFRCFEHLEISLHPRLTVIVADNGGGKTAVLDGIALGLAPILRYLSSANQRLSGPGLADTDFRLIPTQGPDTASDYTQIILESISDLSWDVSGVSSKGKGKQPPGKIGQTRLAEYCSGVLEGIKMPSRQLIPVFAYYGARRGWIEVPGRIRDHKIKYDYPTSALFDALKSLTNFKEMLNWFDLEESSELRANHIAASIDDYCSSPALDLVRRTIEAILGGEFTNPRFNKQHKFVVESKSGPSLLQVGQLSQGYQSMLALGMDFARRLALANEHLEHQIDEIDLWSKVRDYVLEWNTSDAENDYPVMALSGPAWAPAVMLVDEIDLHLHPSWQQRVIGDLMRAFPGTQFIVTTHSPQVLTTVKRENIRILSRDAEGMWNVHMPDMETKGDESATVLAGVMGVDPVPQVPEAAELARYRHLIDLQQHDTEAAKALRKKLDAHFGSGHHLMRDCDRMIRLAGFKARFPVPATSI